MASLNGVYKHGTIIDANHDSINTLLTKGEPVLGLPNKEYEFQLSYLSICDQLTTEGMLDGKHGIFRVPKRVHEAVLFHEGIHFLVRQQEGKLGYPKEAMGFYEILVDETLAELATSESYSFNEKVENSLETAYIGEEDDPIFFLRHDLMFAREIHKKHRAIEAEYIQNEDPRSLEHALKRFTQYLHTLSKSHIKSYLRSAIRGLSIGNALVLREAKIDAKEFVLYLEDCEKQGDNSIDIYLNMILTCSEEFLQPGFK